MVTENLIFIGAKKGLLIGWNLKFPLAGWIEGGYWNRAPIPGGF